jgi:putative FmdB family regulatory protein
MPTYDYVCRNCDHAFELFQSMKDAPKKKCPECGALKLERLIGTGAGVIFKGGGFYETDYRSEGYKKAAEADKPESGKKDTKDKADTGGTKTPDTAKNDKPAPSEAKSTKKKKAS